MDNCWNVYTLKQTNFPNKQTWNIALDVGAAINAHQMQWNQSGRWSKIIIHLGYFHALTYFFDAMGADLMKCYISVGCVNVIYKHGFV